MPASDTCWREEPFSNTCWRYHTTVDVPSVVLPADCTSGRWYYRYAAWRYQRMMWYYRYLLEIPGRGTIKREYLLFPVSGTCP
jgi:hypothetical protein